MTFKDGEVFFADTGTDLQARLCSQSQPICFLPHASPERQYVYRINLGVPRDACVETPDMPWLDTIEVSWTIRGRPRAASAHDCNALDGMWHKRTRQPHTKSCPTEHCTANSCCTRRGCVRQQHETWLHKAMLREASRTCFSAYTWLHLARTSRRAGRLGEVSRGPLNLVGRQRHTFTIPASAAARVATDGRVPLRWRSDGNFCNFVHQLDHAQVRRAPATSSERASACVALLAAVRHRTPVFPTQPRYGDHFSLYRERHTSGHRGATM